MKVPEPRKLKSGNWFIQLRLAGVSVPITAPTKSQCIRTAELYKAQHRSGVKKIKKSVNNPLGVAIDVYIQNRENVLSASTKRGYKKIRNLRFQSVIDTPLKLIDNWQVLINEESAHLKPKTVENAWRLIKSVLKENGIEPPDVRLTPLPKSEHTFLSPEEIRTLIDIVHGKPCEIPVLLGLHSLRRSEILGLEWDDIHLTRTVKYPLGYIHVHQVKVFELSKDENGNEVEILIDKSTGKTPASSRDIPIFIPALYDALNAVDDKTGLIYNYSPSYLRKTVNRICMKNGLPELGAHGLRHSFASYCYSRGIPAKQTMEWGGWSNYKTVMDIYTHLDESARERALKSLMEPFENANKSANTKSKTH